jgi:hypothetical protein
LKTVWEESASGILTPGNIWDGSDYTTSKLSKIKAQAEAVQSLYESANVELPRTCGLAAFIGRAKEVADKWAADSRSLSKGDIFAAMHMMRLAQAILPLREYPGKFKYLTKLTAGEVDFFKRIKSDAKDVIWELELWSVLRSRCTASDLQDPPDIVIRLNGGRLGIACKKIYSEKNIEKVLSQAVAQVKDFEVGMVAVNIDDLIPPDTMLQVDTEAEMIRLLLKQCEDFLGRHERHFRKYLSRGRIAAAFIRVHVIAAVREWKVELNNSGQSLVWTVPGLSPSKKSLFEQFRQAMV